MDSSSQNNGLINPMVAIHYSLLRGSSPRLSAHLMQQIILEIRTKHHHYTTAQVMWDEELKRRN